MNEINKNMLDCHEKEILKKEPFLTRFIASNALMMPRKEVIKYYMDLQNIYKKLGNTRKTIDFQALINEITNSKQYLKMVEDAYTAMCARFSRDIKTIKIIHDNIINACEELGLTEKAEHYKTMLSERLKSFY